MGGAKPLPSRGAGALCEINWAVGNLSYDYGRPLSPPNNNHLLSSIDRRQLFYEQRLAHSSRESIVWLEFLSPLCRCRSCSSERASDLPEVTQLGSDRAGFEIRLSCCGFLCACEGGAGPERWPLNVSGLHTGLGQCRFTACPPTVSTAPCLAPYPQSPPSPGLPLHS